MDYEKILESLKICSEVGTSCEGCSGRSERHYIANLTKAAAIAIEALLHTLDMARGERDVVTKHMVELEQEVGRLRKERDAAIKALDEALIMDNRECFDGENFPCGYRPWCDLCDENEERGCAKAYLELIGPQKEA